MQPKPFHSDWLFYLGDPPEGRWGQADESKWRPVDLPHDWSIELPRQPDAPSGFSGGYFPMGRGYYRKTFTAPPEWQGKKVIIEFEGVYMNAEVWLNENYLGRHPYGYTSFTFDLTPYLKSREKNVLKVCVDNAAQLNSRWYSGSGIYRPVWLYVADPVHIAHWGIYVTTPEVSAEASLVHASIKVDNETASSSSLTLRSHLITPEGTALEEIETAFSVPAGGSLEIVHDLRVAVPMLWSPESPALYRLVSELLSGKEIIDTASTPFGMRSLSFSAEEGFLLNSQPLKLKGGCVHHDNGVLGAVSLPRSEERKVETLKDSGFNAIRCAHNPPSPSFLDACDRLGMLVIDEAFDCWRDGKNPYDYHVAFDDWWQRDLDSMLLRDRNHPSIILWSIGNELIERDNRSNGMEIARTLAERVHEVDPTRPVTAAICGVWDGDAAWTRMDPVFTVLDIGGYNYQFRQYRPDHERLPGRIVCGLESTPGEAFDTWTEVEALTNVIGDFVWTGLDYLGEAGIGRVHFDEKPGFLGAYPWHQANCGDIDLCGFKRPQSYYRDILWGRGSLYIAVRAPIPEGKTPTITYWGWPDVWPDWNWTSRQGQAFQVDIYSPYEKTELFLNGSSLGIKPAGRQERFTASFEVPYEPGELKAVGYQNDRPVAVAVLSTNAAPSRLRLSADRSLITATVSGGLPDLSYVTVELLDRAGAVHPSADRPVYFTITGPAVIAAVGNGNPVSEERYTGNTRSTFRGRCLVVLKSLGIPGEVILRAQADGVDGDEVKLTVI